MTPPGPPALVQALQGYYRIDREIGRGGMATVYLADDVRHGRQVAVKVMHPEIAAAIGPSRFSREIEIAARLNHPHILMLIDSGEAGGFLYYVMPYVDGESLRQRIERDKRLPLDEALRIIDQVASALNYAHGRDVIHRDIKPANILLSGDQAIVADFGIARALEAAGTDRLTGTGVAVGTPTYMSPEQAYGQDNVDGRTDVYALGCVLYEMVAGRPPFEAERPQALFAMHASETPAGLRTLDPDIPLFVERAVGQALAKEPRQRFASPGAFAATLRSESVVAPVGRRRVAVLPPVNVTGDAEQQYLMLGLHESLISQVGQGPVAVLARTSVLQYEGSQKGASEICRELSVDAVVESSLFRAGDAVAIQARLIDGNTQEGLWSGSYNGDLGNVLALYREVCGSVAKEIHGALAPALRPAANPSSPRREVDPRAYENYMRGRVHQQSFNPIDLERAMEYYEAALAIQPDYAAVYSGIALIWGSKVVLGLVPPLEAGPKWHEAARRAVELDPGLAEGHQALAQAYTWFDFDWDRAEASYKRAIELDPNEPQTRIFYSHFLAMMHRGEESDRQMARAVEIDPFNPFTQMLRGVQHGLRGRFEAHVACLAEVPPNPLAAFSSAWGNLMLGNYAEGARFYALYFEMLGDMAAADAVRSAEDMQSGLLAAGELLEARARHTFVKPMNIAMLFGWAGEYDRAFEWIDRCFELRDHELAYLAVIPMSSELRDDPRFTAILQRMRLPLERPFAS